MNAFPEAPIDQMMFGSIHLNPTNMDLLQLKLREIISRGGDINRAGCVHVAAANGYTKTLTMLIEDFKAEVNTQDPAGLTPLHCAATMMQERTIPILLFNGADKKIRDYEGKTALQCCKDAKRSQENFLRSFGIPMQGKMQSADVCIALLKAL